MVSWPWVAVWQVTLALPIIWLFWQMRFKPLISFRLGSGLDWPVVLLVIGLAVSTLFAEFPNQALWYSIAALGGIAALYALSGWLTTSRQAIGLLKFQAALGLVFIALSLGLWLFQTYLPELERLATLAAYGVPQGFNFGITSLRNWYPLGHQNYVAGYLVLILPLFVGLAITDKGWQRWLWIVGCGLGLVDLYTASSRGGSLALVLTVAIALVITLVRSKLPRRLVLPTGGLLLCALLAVTLGNPRVRRPLLSLLQGNTNSSELGYRMITNVVGWRIGLDHPFTGAGPGSVLQVYQQYRPYWAGREAELHFQLHSTPAQLWAELGIFGVASLVSLSVLIKWLTWRWASRSVSPFVHPGVAWSLVAGLLAYGLMALTDYQLDNVAISGILVIYLAVLAKVYQPEEATDANPSEGARVCLGLGLGGLFAIVLWLIPVHRAWAISLQGFEQLNQGNFERFEQSLERSHQLAPWEPYYSTMLAWTSGDFGFQTTGAPSDELKATALDWFETAADAAPYSEFIYSNQGWLLLQTQPDAAVNAFAQACQLVPAKQGVFFGLGVALLANNQPQLATEAMILEILRFPLVMTSPIWQLGELSTIRDEVFNQLEQRYSELMQTAEPTLASHWQQMRGTLYWWQGKYDQAAQNWQEYPTGQTLLQLAQSERFTADMLPDESIVGRDAILAWLQPDQRRFLLERSSINLRDELPKFNVALPPPDLIDQFVMTMEQADSFDSWLKNNNLISQPRSQRLGFGTLHRHIDGHLPVDYYARVVNQPIVQFFDAMFPARKWFRDLDTALQPERDRLLQTISQRQSV